MYERRLIFVYIFFYLAVKEFTIMREEFTDFVHVNGARPDMEAMLDGHILFVNTNPANGEFPQHFIV